MEKMLKCGHELEYYLSDDIGVVCDGAKCKGSEVVAGEPLVGCRTCNVDICAHCAGIKLLAELRDVLGWQEEHVAAFSEGKLLGDHADKIGWTPLHWTCWSGAAVEESLGCMGKKDGMGQTPFMLLCRHGSPDAITATAKKFNEELVQDEVRFDNYKRSYVTNLCLGTSGREHVLEHLKQYPDSDNVFNLLDGFGNCPLHYAIFSQDIPLLKAILSEDGECAKLCTDEGYSPVFLATSGELGNRSGEGSEGDATFSEILRLLLEHGADANEKLQGTLEPPLLRCARDGLEKCCKVLLENGAEVFGKDSSNCNVVHFIVQTEVDPETNEIVGGSDKPFIALLEMILSFVKTEEEKKSLLNHKDDTSRTPLLQACGDNCTAAVLALLRYKNYINLSEPRDSEGLNALHKACWNGNVEMVEALLEAGADAKAFVDASLGGYTAMHFCVESAGEHTVPILRALLKHGADANAGTSRESLSPLHLAALFCSEEACRVIVEEGGANVNAVDCDGDTPLHNAAGKEQNGEDRVDVVKLLLDQGALLEVANRKGFTPLAAAAAAENRDVAAILVKRGAKAVTLEVNEGTNEINVVQETEDSVNEQGNALSSSSTAVSLVGQEDEQGGEENDAEESNNTETDGRQQDKKRKLTVSEKRRLAKKNKMK